MFHIILSLLTLINALLQTEAQVFLPAQIVLPTNRGDTQQTAQTYKDLQDIVGSTNVVQIMSHTFKPPGIVEVWRLIGDDRAIRRVKRLPGVRTFLSPYSENLSSHYLHYLFRNEVADILSKVKYVGDDGPCMNETGLYSRSGTESKVRARAGNVRSQPLRKRTPPVRVIDGNAPWNLKFMSWAPNTMFNNLLGYKYLQADLSDPSYVKSFIYVIENGVDPQTNVSIHLLTSLNLPNIAKKNQLDSHFLRRNFQMPKNGSSQLELQQRELMIVPMATGRALLHWQWESITGLPSNLS